MIRHILTIDLEDWFHCLAPDPSTWSRFPRRVDRVTRRLLDLLDECAARATFFVLGDVAAHAPALIREIVARGHEVGSHGTNHEPVTRSTPACFRADLRDSIACISDLTGRPVEAFRAPYFSITKRSLWALDVLVEEGIRCDSSIFPVHNHRYGIPDAVCGPHVIRPDLIEWPISVVQTRLGNLPFAGGMDFRWLPVSWIELAFARFEARGDRVVFYVHPWELDAEQPRHHPGSWSLYIRHYGRLAGTEARLRALLSRHAFGSLAEARA